MKLSNEEVEALVAYFDVTTINVTKLIPKIGKKTYSNFDKFIQNLYKYHEENSK